MPSLLQIAHEKLAVLFEKRGFGWLAEMFCLLLSKKNVFLEGLKGSQEKVEFLRNFEGFKGVQKDTIFRFEKT